MVSILATRLITGSSYCKSQLISLPALHRVWIVRRRQQNALAEAVLVTSRVVQIE